MGPGAKFALALLITVVAATAFAALALAVDLVVGR